MFVRARHLGRNFVVCLCLRFLPDTWRRFVLCTPLQHMPPHMVRACLVLVLMHLPFASCPGAWELLHARTPTSPQHCFGVCVSFTAHPHQALSPHVWRPPLPISNAASTHTPRSHSRLYYGRQPLAFTTCFHTWVRHALPASTWAALPSRWRVGGTRPGGLCDVGSTSLSRS